ncbi:MAG: helix-hairpin-helix domain-containing protein [bacterium]
MAAGGFFQRLFERNRAVSPPPAHLPGPAPVAPVKPAAVVSPDVASPAAPSVSPVVAPAAKPAEAAAPARNMEFSRALEELRSIRAALAEDEPTLSVPCDAVLRRLPAELRGPAWRADSFPDAELKVPRKELLAQLGAGRVLLPLSQFMVDLPAGWLIEHAPHQTPVELDLSRVVPLMPRDWMQPKARPREVAAEIGSMPDFFVAKRTAVPAAAVPPAVPPAPAAAVPPAVAPEAAVVVPPAREMTPPVPSAPPVLPAVMSVDRPPASPAEELPETPEFAPRVIEEPAAVEENAAPASGVSTWDGRDVRADAGPSAIDVNRAALEDLLRLPGVGPHVAEAILAHRRTHGAFASVFDLAGVEGVGPKLFRKMTGLSLATRQDRHEVLNAALGLEPDARPSLAVIAQRFSARLDGAGVVLSTLDGMPLASSQQVADDAVRYAAIVPQMFRRTRRYFRQLLETEVHCMVIPTSRPMVLLVDANALFLVVTLKPEQDVTTIMNATLGVAQELHWLLDCRAVVS